MAPRRILRNNAGNLKFLVFYGWTGHPVDIDNDHSRTIQSLHWMYIMNNLVNMHQASVV